METSAATAQFPEITTCTRCRVVITGTENHEITPDGIICRSCSESHRWELERSRPEQGQEINYPAALMGALLGGAAGVLAWWIVTVWSHISFGAVAILIGIAVGKGATLMSGNQRSRGLQILSATVAGASFFYATYLVHRSFLQQALAQAGKEASFSLLPDPMLFFRVVSLNFEMFDVLFLAIVLWEAWKLTAPVKPR
jgi:hypothetical protein